MASWGAGELGAGASFSGGGGAGEEFLAGVEVVAPPSPACSPCPPYPAAELPQGGGTPPGEVRGGGRGRPLSLGSWNGGGVGLGWGTSFCCVGSREARSRGCRLWGEGGANIGWRWPAWWRLGDWQWRERRPGNLQRCPVEWEP